MEITKKLEIFYASAIEVANKESRDIINEYEDSLRTQLDEYTQNKKQEADSMYQIEEARIRREINRGMSEAITEKKRKLNVKQQEKKKILFERVKQMCMDYRNTEGYEAYLVSKICMAKAFAAKNNTANGIACEDDFTIYLNPTDAGKKEKLEEETGCRLTVSETDFEGGIRAVIRSKNVLIDESFVTRMDQEREGYTF